MKIKNFEIDSFCSNFNNTTPAILIYGQDYGLKQERANSIIKNYIENSSNVIELEMKSIILNPEIIKTELNSISLLNNKKVIKIHEADDKISATIKDNILLNNKDCLLILISDNLPPKSKLRNLFENHKDAVIVPCYSDDNKNILNLIDDLFLKENIRIDINAKKLLSNYLGVDRLVTRGEIEKAILYAGTKKHLSIEDISAFLSDQASINIDELYDLILLGDIKQAYKILLRLQNEGVQPIQVFRSFTRQLQNLYSMRERYIENMNVNDVIDSFKPPIYFKRKENIKCHTKEWSITMINQALVLIENAEINCKKLKANPNNIAKQTILNLGLMKKNESISF